MILKPLSAQLEIIEGCTHSCRHCYNYYSQNRNNTPVRDDVLFNIINSDLFDITLTGGEPLKAKEVFFKSLKKFKEANMDVSLNSNLYLLNQKDAEKMKSLEINSILSSILGPNSIINDKITNVRGSFKKLCESLNYLTKEKINVSLNMVVSKLNFKYVYETGKFVFETFGIKNFDATPMVISPGRDEEDLRLSREEYVSTLDTLLMLESCFGIIPDSLHPAIPCMFKDNQRNKYRKFFETRSCVAGKGTIIFSPTGDVRPCSHEKRTFGNIISEPLEKILRNMEEWSQGKLIPKECKVCVYLSRCNGGCRVAAEATYGKLDSVDPYFTKPVKEKLPEIKQKEIDINSFGVIKGKIRYRKDNFEITTVYINRNSNARLNNLEFEIFKRIIKNKTYKDISHELGDPELAKNIIKNLARKGLLT